MTRFTMMTLAAAALATPALADDLADSDGDGLYTLADVQAAYPDVSEDAYAIADTSGDGLLDADEVAAARDAGILPS